MSSSLQLFLHATQLLQSLHCHLDNLNRVHCSVSSIQVTCAFLPQKWQDVHLSRFRLDLKSITKLQILQAFEASKASPSSLSSSLKGSSFVSIVSICFTSVVQLLVACFDEELAFAAEAFSEQNV